MSTQDRGQARRNDRDTDQEHDAPDAVGASATRESSMDTAELDADVDAILDEIDEVLEVNAEDFVKSFVQKGGQ